MSDSTGRADLTSKATVYAEGGVEHYSVLARDALHVHAGPTLEGYEREEVLGPDGPVTPPYAPVELSVAELLGRGSARSST